MDIMIGADPELFIRDSKGKLVGAHNFIPGTKKNPSPVQDGALQVDGMAAEFNITPVATSGQLIHNVNSVLRQLKRFIPETYTLDISPVAHFDKEVMRAAPETALELGCDPDFNAWSQEMNPPPSLADEFMRTAAGHIHIGWTVDKNVHDPDHFFMCCAVVRQLDFFLGVPSLMLDGNNERRKMYGKAGAFRPKPYGVEYRVLSNFWIKDNRYMKWVYENTMAGFDSIVTKGYNLARERGPLAQDIIDSCNVEEAIKLCKELKINYPKV